MAARRAAASWRTASAGAANPATARTSAPPAGQLPPGRDPAEGQQRGHRGHEEQAGDGGGGLLGQQPFRGAAEDGQVGAQGLAGQAEPREQGRRRAAEPRGPAAGVEREHRGGPGAGQEVERVGEAGAAGGEPGGDGDQAEGEPGSGEQRGGHGRAPFAPASAAVPRLTSRRGSSPMTEILWSHQNPAAKHAPTTSSISCPAGVP